MLLTHDRQVLQFTREALEEGLEKTEELFFWARDNMHHFEPNTLENERWLNLMMHFHDQIVDLKERIEFSPSESLQ